MRRVSQSHPVTACNESRRRLYPTDSFTFSSLANSVWFGDSRATGPPLRNWTASAKSSSPNCGNKLPVPRSSAIGSQSSRPPRKLKPVRPSAFNRFHVGSAACPHRRRGLITSRLQNMGERRGVPMHHINPFRAALFHQRQQLVEVRMIGVGNQFFGSGPRARIIERGPARDICHAHVLAVGDQRRPMRGNHNQGLAGHRFRFVRLPSGKAIAVLLHRPG